MQTEIATGKRIMRPSDDPAGAVRALSLRKVQAFNAQWQRNITYAVEWNTATEAAISSLVERVTEIKEIAVRGANDPSAERDALALSVDAVLDEMLSLSCTTADGRHIFAGYEFSQSPYVGSTEVTEESFVAGALGTEVDLEHARIVSGTVLITDSSGVTMFTEGVDYSIEFTTGRITALSGGGMTPGTAYLASYETEGTSSVEETLPLSGEIVRQINDDRTITINLLGSEVFGDQADLFTLAVRLKNALWKDDTLAVQNLLAEVDAAGEHITELQGVIGHRAEVLQTEQLSLESESIFTTSLLAEVEEVDLAEVVLELRSEQMGYEAALAAAARLHGLSLLDYM